MDSGPPLGLLLSGSSPPAQALEALVRKAARSSAPVVVVGEGGAGKSALASALHRLGPRSGGAFVATSLAALAPTLIEAELFGHEEGAFTGAGRSRLGRFRQAHGGTLVLEDLDHLPLELQGKLLRVLQEGEVEPLGAERAVKIDVRVIATSSRDLRASVESGALRSDLYWRIAVLEIVLPPLRTRVEDIVPLANALFAREGSRRTLSRSAAERLCAHPWPGNVRELENAVARVLALGGAERGEIEASEFEFLLEETAGRAEELAQRALAQGLTLDALESALIQTALREQRGNVAAAARQIGLSRRALEYRIERRKGGNELR
ncbi:MAG: sigma-54-dependent Fis family transcriptional regulator [Planctomycetes bacterium]|nr:sigma-54-dependent Fis family transcriptional regulator [Planctomycetota bacterium]